MLGSYSAAASRRFLASIMKDTCRLRVSPHRSRRLFASSAKKTGLRPCLFRLLLNWPNFQKRPDPRRDPSRHCENVFSSFCYSCKLQAARCCKQRAAASSELLQAASSCKQRAAASSEVLQAASSCKQRAAASEKSKMAEYFVCKNHDFLKKKS